MIITKGLKIRIYPTEEQKQLINQFIGSSRFVYNQTLNFRQLSFKQGKKVKQKDINKFLNDLKAKQEYDWLQDMESTSLQQAQRDLDKAYKNFFEKRSGFPKFHSKKKSKESYRCQNVHNKNDTIRFVEDIQTKKLFLVLPKLGLVKFKGKLRDEMSILNATVEHTKTDKYMVSICYQTDYTPIENAGCLVGLDLGLKQFITDSNGNEINNPRFLEKATKKLKKLQRQFSRKQYYKSENAKNSNREKARLKLAKGFEKVTNQRNDFLQKLSTQLINENQVIVIEDLNIKGMLKNHKLARSISSASWSKFVNMLEYKANWNGNQIIKVDRFFASSKICNHCGYKKEDLSLSDREWKCPQCGEIIYRDKNTAKNILQEGRKILNKNTVGYTGIHALGNSTSTTKGNPIVASRIDE